MFDWWTFLFQTLNFFVVLYILYRLFFTPLKRVIEQREETVGERLGRIEKAEARLKADRAGCAEEKKAIQSLRERVLDEAKAEALTEKEALMKAAEQEREKALEKQRGIIEQERQKYEKELRRRSLEFALFYTKKLLGGLCDPALHEKRIERFLETLSKETSGEIAALKSALANHPCSVVLHTPYLPDKQTLDSIGAAIQAVFSCDSVEVTAREDASLICGIRLEIGNKILDGSLKEELERFADDTASEMA